MTLHEMRLSIKTKKLTYVSFLIKTISFEQWKRWRNKKVYVCSRTFDWIIFVLVSHIETRSQVPQADQDPDIEVNKNDKWNEAWKYREVRSESTRPSLGTCTEDPCPGLIVNYVLFVHPQGCRLHVISAVNIEIRGSRENLRKFIIQCIILIACFKFSRRWWSFIRKLLEYVNK